MVKPAVWAEAGYAEDDGWICRQCLEADLGRALRGTDLLLCTMTNMHLLHRGEITLEEFRVLEAMWDAVYAIIQPLPYPLLPVRCSSTPE